MGIGRTGTLFAYESSGVVPDIMTLAKGLGGGVAIGAAVASERVAAAFAPGSHASTFGGNPLATAAGLAVLETILEEGVLENCRKVGGHLREGLERLALRHPGLVREVRGRGLLQAMDLTVAGGPIVERLHAPGPAHQLHGEYRAAFPSAPDRYDGGGGRDAGNPGESPCLDSGGGGGRIMTKHFLTLADFGQADLRRYLDRAIKLKEATLAGKRNRSLEGKILGLVFEKPSLRTRVTFEVGMRQLGGDSIYLSAQEVQLGVRESVADVARNLDRMVDGIVLRTFRHEVAEELARNSSDTGDQRAYRSGSPLPGLLGHADGAREERDDWKVSASRTWGTATTWPIRGSWAQPSWGWS